MTWKWKFSGIVFLAVSFALSFSTVSAQRIKIRKSVSGRVAATQEYRGNLADDENSIHDLVNNERRRRGLSELSWDGKLANLAREYSGKMARESFFSHFDRDGDSVIERARQSNIKRWNKIGENLFFCEGYDNFDALAVRGWLDSPEHRRNMLDPQFNATGIGIARTRDGRIYITQVFIRN